MLKNVTECHCRLRVAAEIRWKRQFNRQRDVSETTTNLVADSQLRTFATFEVRNYGFGSQ